ncbi:MAG: SpoIID/LytB domain-containing protein [Bacteroidota bacterium]
MKSICFIAVLITLFIASNLSGQKIDVRIYTKYKINSIVFSPVEGKYDLMSDSVLIYQMKKHNVILLDVINDSINVRDLDGNIGRYKSLDIIGVGKNNYFRMKSINPDYKPRDYDDNLYVKVVGGYLLLINNVDLEFYIAGVVESEGGIKSLPEYYKSQAIITRTYALENLLRHSEEKYNLCDDVHCQAYHGKSLNSLDIAEATFDTKGLVIVDTTLSLITATFHSNCGGQTCSSENVWLTQKSYLKSVRDSFCTESPNATWTTTIETEKWEQFLNAYGIKTNTGTYNLNNYSFSQPYRMTYYVFNNESIALKVIRQEWKLKSTYFNITQKGNQLIFTGKGYGHGVGLCQEGAMEMARKGYNYEEIINFYYKNIYIVSLRALSFFKVNE